MKWIYFLFIMSFCAATFAQRETVKREGFSYVKLPNGVNAVYAEGKSSNMQITLLLRCGSLMETDTNRGAAYILQNIAAQKIASRLSKNIQGLSFQTINFSAYTTTEQTVFQFTSSAAQLQQVLKLIADSVFMMKFTAADVLKVKEDIAQEQKIIAADPEKAMQKLMTERLFRFDAHRLNITGGEKLAKTTTVAVDSFFNRYYVTNSAVIAIAGNVSTNILSDALDKTIGLLPTPDFNSEAIVKLFTFRPMVYSSQYTQKSAVDSPELQLCWQLPGLNSNISAGHLGYLLSAIINDKANYIQTKLRKMGCQKFEAQFEANNFYSILKIVAKPSVGRFHETNQFIQSELNRINSVLVNETMMNAAKIRFKEEYFNLMNSASAPFWIAKYWPFTNEDYFQNLGDSILNTDVAQLKKYTAEYIKESPHFAVLFVNEDQYSALKLDSLFPDLDETINETEFTYRQNITDLEGKENLDKRNKLLHWAKLNSDILLQVNGFADEGEFNKTYDDSVLAFIDSIPTFRKTNPDLLKKGYLRPEMMRAMKILKYLSDNGISMERLTGTSMRASSKNKKEALANMKCSVSLNKLREKTSLYEYHYGVPKPKE